MKRYVHVFVFCLTLFHLVSAEDFNVFINPGVKFGIAFGKKPGVVLGFETSVLTVAGDFGLTGFVLGASHCFNGTRNITAYGEFEYLYLLFCGGSVGLVYDSYLKDFDPYARVFGGYGIYLSYRYALGKIPNELSFVLKVPVYPVLLRYDEFMSEMD